nr:hypothetical protein MZNIZDYX_MZNIZDYX_CDS_0024 [uncultured phage]CAI9752136.1 hypothetical protein GCSOEBMH_GCSOEBMH_CDS_0024 [uncultured phage]
MAHTWHISTFQFPCISTISRIYWREYVGIESILTVIGSY